MSEVAPVPNAAPAAPTDPPAGAVPADDDHDRLGLFVAIALATLGVLGALVAWRLGDVGTIADNATRDALMARQRAGVSEVSGSIATLEGFAAWLDYETARYRGLQLFNEDHEAEAFDAYQTAVGHWFAVPAAFLDFDGDYDPIAHRDALVAEAAVGNTPPEEHLAVAQAAEAQVGRLGIAGFILAAALPFLTAAEVIGRRRARYALAGTGSVILVAGVAALIVAWI